LARRWRVALGVPRLTDDPEEPSHLANGWQLGRRRPRAQAYRPLSPHIQYNYSGGSSTASRLGRRVTRDSPYPGLEAFTEEDGGDLLGRDVAAAKLLEAECRSWGIPRGSVKWLELPCCRGFGGWQVLVVGPAVLPRIRRGELRAQGSALWPQLIFSPRPQPLDALGEAGRAEGADHVSGDTGETSSTIRLTFFFAHTAAGQNRSWLRRTVPRPASANAESRRGGW